MNGWAKIRERLEMERESLRMWESGKLQDYTPEKREDIKRRLLVIIYTLEWAAIQSDDAPKHGLPPQPAPEHQATSPEPGNQGNEGPQ